MCTSQNSHSSLVKTHRSQCIQSSCFLADLTLLFLSKLPFSLQLLHTHTPPKVTCTWLQHLDSHPENHLGPWLQTQSKERAGPTPIQRQTVGNAYRHPVTHAKQCSGAHTSRSLWAQSSVEALGDEQTCGHTHAHLQTITCAHGHAHRHPNPPTFRHPHRCLTRPQHQAPPPPFRRRWEDWGLRALPLLPPSGPISPRSRVPEVWRPPRPPTWLGERMARGGWEAWSQIVLILIP